jgi:hypothetical protein
VLIAALGVSRQCIESKFKKLFSIQEQSEQFNALFSCQSGAALTQQEHYDTLRIDAVVKERRTLHKLGWRMRIQQFMSSFAPACRKLLPSTGMPGVGWREYVILYGAAFSSLLAGASLVHNWLRPDLTLPNLAATVTRDAAGAVKRTRAQEPRADTNVTP